MSLCISSMWNERKGKKRYFSHPKLQVLTHSAAWWRGGPRARSAHLAGGLLLLRAEILRHFPAAGGEVEDGSGSHVCSLGIVGVVEACGGR